MSSSTETGSNLGAHDISWDYEHKFDGESYLQAWYPGCKKGDPMHEMSVQTMTWLHQLFDSGKYHGKRLLDVCSGPSLHAIISGSKYFSEIYLTDFATKNRAILKKWLHNDDGAYDWTEFFEFVAELEGGRSTGLDIEQRVRSCIKGVLPCDVREEQPFGQFQSEYTPADVIITSLTVDAVAKDFQDSINMLKAIGSMLKTGGYVIYFGAVECSYYCLGNEKFPTLYVTKESLLESLTLAGFKLIDYMESTCENNWPIELTDVKGFMMLSAIKI